MQHFKRASHMRKTNQSFMQARSIAHLPVGAKICTRITITIAILLECNSMGHLSNIHCLAQRLNSHTVVVLTYNLGTALGRSLGNSLYGQTEVTGIKLQLAPA